MESNFKNFMKILMIYLNKNFELIKLRNQWFDKNMSKLATSFWMKYEYFLIQLFSYNSKNNLLTINNILKYVNLGLKAKIMIILLKHVQLKFSLRINSRIMRFEVLNKFWVDFKFIIFYELK